MKYFLFLLCLFAPLKCTSVKDPKVLIAILARNKAHTLPKYLECIENLDYNKKAITLYINTYNNSDQTEGILESWLNRVGDQYQDVIFESHDVAALSDDATRPHDWNAKRVTTLGQIRQKSLQKTLDCGCDYYFVVDCDIFITPPTLKALVAKRKPIIAPLLTTVPQPNPFSNYFCEVNEYGYFKDDPFYYAILNHSIRGTFQVPVVLCSYLVDAQYIPNLSFVDGSDEYEFIIFSRMARNYGISQYVCNEREFGYIFQPRPLGEVRDISLEEEVEMFQTIDLPL